MQALVSWDQRGFIEGVSMLFGRCCIYKKPWKEKMVLVWLVDFRCGSKLDLFYSIKFSRLWLWSSQSRFYTITWFAASFWLFFSSCVPNEEPANHDHEKRYIIRIMKWNFHDISLFELLIWWIGELRVFHAHLSIKEFCLKVYILLA